MIRQRKQEIKRRRKRRKERLRKRGLLTKKIKQTTASEQSS